MTTKINYKEEIIKKCQEAQNKSGVDVSNYLKTHDKIDIDTVKKIMKVNYFPDSDKLPILVYGIGTNNICFAFDMFDIQIMLADNYDFDTDDLHSIEEELSYLVYINIHRSKVEIDGLYRPIPADVNISLDDIF